MEKIKYILIGIQNAFSSIDFSDLRIKRYSDISKNIYQKRMDYINETYKKETKITAKRS